MELIVAGRCTRCGGASDVRLHDVVGLQRCAAQRDVLELSRESRAATVCDPGVPQ